jgi:hypothetical protein
MWVRYLCIHPYFTLIAYIQQTNVHLPRVHTLANACPCMLYTTCTVPLVLAVPWCTCVSTRNEHLLIVFFGFVAYMCVCSYVSDLHLQISDLHSH